MRITRETLHTIARELAENYARRNRDLACIYLTGSLLGDSPLLGGTTDIDLVFVHTSAPAFPREVVRLSDEVHLDIAHFSQTVFHQPRHLRVEPWIGAHLFNNAISLYDTAHWFELPKPAPVHSSTCRKMWSPVRALAAEARQSWLDLEMNPAHLPPPGSGLSIGARKRCQQHHLHHRRAAGRTPLHSAVSRTCHCH